MCVFLLLCCCSVLLSGAAITEPSDGKFVSVVWIFMNLIPRSWC